MTATAKIAVGFLGVAGLGVLAYVAYEYLMTPKHQTTSPPTPEGGGAPQPPTGGAERAWATAPNPQQGGVEKIAVWDLPRSTSPQSVSVPLVKPTTLPPIGGQPPKPAPVFVPLVQPKEKDCWNSEDPWDCEE